MMVNLEISPKKEPVPSEVKILLIEDDREDAEIITRILETKWASRYSLTHYLNLNEGLKSLHQSSFDLLLLDLTLPDTDGLSTFMRARQEKADIPIVVLTGLDDERLAYQAMKQGAQDYLVKQNVNASTLNKAISYALQRQQLLNELRSMSLTDELTGLYNRRGFMFLGQQQLNGAGRRQDESLFLLVADLDNMKQINDRLGHQYGDYALMDFAKILRQTFRASDLLSRIGGDEFAILAVDTSNENPPRMINRLKKMVNDYNLRTKQKFKLRYSVGTIPYDPKAHRHVKVLLNQADLLMYKDKRNKKKSPAVYR